MTFESDKHHTGFQPGSPARKRAQMYGRKDTVAAKKVVAATQVKLSTWHSRVAFLRAWGTGKPDDVSAALEQAASLLPLVIAERIELERLIEESDMDIGRHTIVRDVMKALISVQAHIEKIAYAIPPPHGETERTATLRRAGAPGPARV